MKLTVRFSLILFFIKVTPLFAQPSLNINELIISSELVSTTYELHFGFDGEFNLSEEVDSIQKYVNENERYEVKVSDYDVGHFQELTYFNRYAEDSVQYTFVEGVLSRSSYTYYNKLGQKDSMYSISIVEAEQRVTKYYFIHSKEKNKEEIIVMMKMPSSSLKLSYKTVKELDGEGVVQRVEGYDSDNVLTHAIQYDYMKSYHTEEWHFYGDYPFEFVVYEGEFYEEECNLKKAYEFTTTNYRQELLSALNKFRERLTNEKCQASTVVLKDPRSYSEIVIETRDQLSSFMMNSIIVEIRH